MPEVPEDNGAPEDEAPRDGIRKDTAPEGAAPHGSASDGSGEGPLQRRFKEKLSSNPELRRLAEDALSYHEKSISENTRRAYRSGWKDFLLLLLCFLASPPESCTRC